MMAGCVRWQPSGTAAAYSKESYCRDDMYDQVVGWNDDPLTTADDVISHLRASAVKYETAAAKLI